MSNDALFEEGLEDENSINPHKMDEILEKSNKEQYN